MSNLDEFVSRSIPDVDRARAARRTRGKPTEPARRRRRAPARRVLPRERGRSRARAPSLPGDAVVVRLEQLVQRGRQGVYNAPSSRTSVWEFFSTGYWRRVRERKLVLAISFLCLAVPTLLGGYWAWRDPGPASGLVPGQYQSVTAAAHAGPEPGHVASTRSRRWPSQIFTNNIRVTFLAFAGGLLLGVGTLYVLLQNGVMLGVVAGLAIGAGNGRVVLRARHRARRARAELHRRGGRGRVAARLGDHRPRQRDRAARRCAQEARAAIEIVLGTAPWLVVAGLVEGFVTPAGTGLAAVLAVGLSPGRDLLGSRVVARRARPGRRSQPRARLEPQVGAHARFAEQRGRRLDHRRAEVPQTLRSPAPARRARRARPRRRRRRAALSGACMSGASRSGSRTDATTTACRRASTGTASRSDARPRLRRRGR